LAAFRDDIVSQWVNLEARMLFHQKQRRWPFSTNPMWTRSMERMS